MPPVRLRIAVGPGDVSYGAALHDGIGHAALLGTIPYRRFTRAALMIGIEPCRELTYLLQIFHRIEPAAKIAHVNGLRVLLMRNLVPETPDLLHAIHINFVVLAVNRIRGICFGRRHAAQLLEKAPATLAIADTQRTG